jgi:hypothetical protein
MKIISGEGLSKTNKQNITTTKKRGWGLKHLRCFVICCCCFNLFPQIQKNQKKSMQIHENRLKSMIFMVFRIVMNLWINLGGRTFNKKTKN